MTFVVVRHVSAEFYGNGGVRRQCREMGGEIGENEHNFHHVRFRDALCRGWAVMIWFVSVVDGP